MYQILNRIPRDDFEFMFFCGVPPDKELGFDVFQLPTISIPYNTSYEAALPFLAKKKLTQKLEAFNPDVIHFASPSPLGSFANKYGIANNIPVVSIYHTHFISYVKYYFDFAKFTIPYFQKKAKEMTKRFYKDPHIVYVPTKEIIKDLKEKCELDGSNLKLWQRGINNKLFNPSKKDKAYLKELVGNDKPNILFASRLVWEKNLQSLIDFYKKCEAEKAEVNIIVAGDGVVRKELQRKMPNAKFLGMIGHEELAKVYASSDIFFFPSVTETYGNVVIEAMASGIPCVVANGGGPKSFITHGVNGMICEADNISEFWDAIRDLLNDKERYHKMVHDGLAFTDSLSWDKLANIYFEDLKHLVRKEGSFVKIPVYS
jgi:glycosyltransferase involved in cell wall biosynthesis